MGNQEKVLSLMKKNLIGDEKVLCYVDGAFETLVNNKSNVKTGILAATSEKIRFCGKRFFLVYDDSIEYEDILDIELKEEKLGYSLFIKGKEKPYFMKFIVSEDVHKFIKLIKEKINKN